MCFWCNNVCKGAPTGSTLCNLCSKCHPMGIWDNTYTPLWVRGIDTRYQNEMVQDYLDQCAGGKPTTWVQLDDEAHQVLEDLAKTHNLTHREVLNYYVLPAAERVINGEGL